MTIVRCPRCRDEVSVPAGASKQALVRCPLCQDQYRLEEAVAGVPPPLLVLSDEGADVESFAVPGAGRRRAGSAYSLSEEAPPDRLFDARPGTGQAAPARPMVAGSPRPRRKEKSIVGEMLKVVLGGVAGLGLGLLVLWWGFGQDVGDLGPTVARYAPWIVPAKLHGNSNGQAAAPDDPAVTQAGPGTASDNGRTTWPRGEGARSDLQAGAGLDFGAQFDDALQQSRPLDDALGAGDELGVFGEPARLPPTELDDGSPLGLTIDDPLDVTRPASADIELPSLDPWPATDPEATPPPETLEPVLDVREIGPPTADEPATARPAAPDLTDLLPEGPFEVPSTKEATTDGAQAPVAAESPAEPQPLITPDKLATAVDAAQAALARYDELPRDDKDALQQAFTDFYLAGSEMGRIVSYLSTSDPELAESLAALQSFLHSVSGKQGASKVSAVKFLAGQHWRKRQHGEGLLVAGVVKDIQSAGPLFETTLDASVRNSTLSITIVTAVDLGETTAIGDELVVVGRVIDEPQASLPGYEGNAERVLLYGYSVKVPKQNR